MGQWAHTGIAEPRRMVIRDANGFAQPRLELGAGERPDVDFTQNVVVVAASGEQSSGGHGIAIDRVSQADGQLTIHVVQTTPGPNCVTTGAATRPVDVVVVPAAAPRGWSFLERKDGPAAESGDRSLDLDHSYLAAGARHPGFSPQSH